LLLVLRFAPGVQAFPAQSSAFTPDLLDRYQIVLRKLKDELKDKYYDGKFHGINIDKSFEQTKDKLKQAQSNGQALGIIAEFLLALNDSHTWFIPPTHKFIPNYGWTLQMIGNDCYVMDVVKDSDADKKSIRAGDKVLNVDGYMPVRENFWKLSYLIHTLRPQDHLDVVVQSRGGEQRQLTILANLKDRFAK